jgi:hypothetical protein
MPRAERNRRLFASAIAGSGSTTTPRRTRLAGTDPTAPFVVGEEEERATRTETSNAFYLLIY